MYLIHVLECQEKKSVLGWHNEDVMYCGDVQLMWEYPKIFLTLL